MPQRVVIEPWFDDVPSRDVIEGAVGRILDIFVDGVLGSEPVPFGEFSRFARVLGVRSDGVLVCLRCNSEAQFEITIQWEEGYDCPQGNKVCEQCVAGVVAKGSHDYVESWAWPNESAAR